MDDRRPNFVPISIPFSRFDIILECSGQTNGRTDLLYQYRSLQNLLLVLNYCRDCRVFESRNIFFLCRILLQKYFASSSTQPTPLVCLRHWRTVNV